MPGSLAGRPGIGAPGRSRVILILGGSSFQVPLIRLAKSRGHHVVTCDYLPSNPGHAWADEYHDVSTTDRPGVLALARRLRVDAIATMASEPALQTVAHVAQALGLPGTAPDTVAQLTQKDLFRSVMRRSGLPTPRHVAITAVDAARASDAELDAAVERVAAPRVVVKPVDGWGSKGITVLDAGGAGARAAVRHALENSMAGRCIVEAYVEGEQVHGDVYLSDHRVTYAYLGDHRFYASHGSRIPIATLWPTRHGADVLAELRRQIERLSAATGYACGPANIEARVTPAGDVVVVEMAPRNGGNLVPIVQQHLTGFDFTGRVLDLALGEVRDHPPTKDRFGVGAVCVLHAPRDGRLRRVDLSDEARASLVGFELFRHPGDRVNAFVRSNAAVGVALLEFTSIDARDRLVDNVQDHLAVRLDGE